jgi:acyl-CoA thioester hydrolase
MKTWAIADFPVRTYDKIRYADTDRQGHVNNAVFATFLETGRVEVLYNPEFPLHDPDTSFVIASLKLDFMLEITWPGLVEIGTAVTKIGNSSIVLYQMLFQNNRCVAQAETVIVQIYQHGGGKATLSEMTKNQVQQWLISDAPDP